MAPKHNRRKPHAIRVSDSMEECLRPQHNGGHQMSDTLSRPHQAFLVFVLLLGLFFSSLDASIVSTSLVTISLDLSDFVNANWVALSYLLSYLGFAINFARLSDHFGRRALVITAWVLFSCFSLLCGVARNMQSLIVFRAFQGIGGSGLYSLAQIGLYEVGPSNKPSLLGALVGVTLALSFVLGPLLGGMISKLANWRWIFYINIPFGMLAAIASFYAWPQSPTSPSQPKKRLKELDVPGNILIIMGSSLLIFSFQQISTFDYPVRSPRIVVTMAIALLSIIGFAGWEFWLWQRRRGIVQPILPIGLLVDRVYLATVMCTLFSGLTYLSIIIILPERFQIVNSDDSLMAGIHLLPMLGACAFGSFLAGALSSKRNNTSITLVAASALQLIGVGLLSTLSDVTTAIGAQYGYQAIFGLGIGLSFAAATIITSVRAGSHDLAVAHGMIAQARVFGGAVGIIACMTIVNAQIIHDLGNMLVPADLNALQRNPVSASYFPLDMQLLIHETYSAAFTSDIKMMMAVSAVGLIASFFALERHPPPLPNNQQPRKQLEVGQEQGDMELAVNGH